MKDYNPLEAITPYQMHERTISPDDLFNFMLNVFMLRKSVINSSAVSLQICTKQENQKRGEKA